MKIALIRPNCAEGHQPSKPLSLKNTEMLSALPKIIENINADLVITSEAVCGSVPLKRSEVDKCLSNVKKPYLISILCSEIPKEDIDNLKNFWSQKPDFICPRYSRKPFNEKSRPFKFTESLLKNITYDTYFNISSIGCFDANNKTTNYKIQQGLPYWEGIYKSGDPYSYALEGDEGRYALEGDEGRRYLGGYLNSWTSFSAKSEKIAITVHVFNRICMDVELGPEETDIKHIGNLPKTDKKIFVIQAATYTPSQFFGGIDSAFVLANRVMGILIGLFNSTVLDTPLNFEKDQFPRKFTIPGGYWEFKRLESDLIIKTKEEEEILGYIKENFQEEGEEISKYFNFIREFDYIIFADHRGPDQYGAIYKIEKTERKDSYYKDILLTMIEQKEKIYDKYFGCSTYELSDIFVKPESKSTSNFSLEEADKKNFSTLSVGSFGDRGLSSSTKPSSTILQKEEKKFEAPLSNLSKSTNTSKPFSGGSKPPLQKTEQIGKSINNLYSVSPSTKPPTSFIKKNDQKKPK